MKTTNKIDKHENIILKPDCVIDYNANMGLVDKSDMQILFNTTSRKSIKWYKIFFFHLQDICVLNSGIVCSILEKKTLKLQEFRSKLIEQILHAYILSDDTISPRCVGRKPKDYLPLRLNARHFPSRINSGEVKKKIPEGAMSILIQN